MNGDIEALKEAILRLAEVVDSLAWRIASEEERKHLDILDEIRRILDT